jgi:hypothetical protein
MSLDLTDPTQELLVALGFTESFQMGAVCIVERLNHDLLPASVLLHNFYLHMCDWTLSHEGEEMKQIYIDEEMEAPCVCECGNVFDLDRGNPCKGCHQTHCKKCVKEPWTKCPKCKRKDTP